VAYTQNYGIAPSSPPEAISRCLADLTKVAMHGYLAGELAGPPVPGASHRFVHALSPEVTPEHVIFSGAPERNPRGTSFHFPPPDYGSPLVVKALAAGVTDGLYEDPDSGDYVSLYHGSVYHDTNTHLLPFDSYVVAALLLVRDHLGEFAWISSDGFADWGKMPGGFNPEDHYVKGRQIVQECCGYLPNDIHEGPTDIRAVLGQPSGPAADLGVD
jgi:hypothetical protein